MLQVSAWGNERDNQNLRLGFGVFQKQPFFNRLLGGQGNLWTEYVPNFKHAQFMAFPRMCALAEVTWSPQASRNWEDFTRRLQTQFQRFDQLGVNYRKGTPERIGE